LGWGVGCGVARKVDIGGLGFDSGIRESKAERSGLDCVGVGVGVGVADAKAFQPVVRADKTFSPP
jgi:hypothetical protein